MAGAAVEKAGWDALIASGLQKIIVFIVLSPLIGLLLGFHRAYRSRARISSVDILGWPTLRERATTRAARSGCPR